MKIILSAIILVISFHVHAFACETIGPKRGYWFYNECKNPDTEKDPYEPEPLPAHAEMMKMHPKQLRELVTERLEFAVYKQTPESVVQYYQVIDVARRKALAFTALTEYVMLKNPELNAKTQNPSTVPARNQSRLTRDNEYFSYINQHRSDFALVMLSRESCQYCVVQEATLKQFGAKYQWRYKLIDIDLNPDIALKFNATSTPMTIIIERDTNNWMPVSVGAESVPEVESGVYRALRFLRDEITPTQFITDRFRDGGFFDPIKQAQE